tara:strand:- start:38 stop:205 length:168 start_codon:yes stop_codon:yes gene_type:complete
MFFFTTFTTLRVQGGSDVSSVLLEVARPGPGGGGGGEHSDAYFNAAIIIVARTCP